jgi:hypothetical protein
MPSCQTRSESLSSPKDSDSESEDPCVWSICQEGNGAPLQEDLLLPDPEDPALISNSGLLPQDACNQTAHMTREYAAPESHSVDLFRYGRHTHIHTMLTCIDVCVCVFVCMCKSAK